MPKASRKTTNSKRKTRNNGRGTVVRLLEVGSDELARKGIDGFDLDHVLKKSKTSKGSLYHHFGSRGGFIAAIETEEFRQHLSGANQYLRELVEACNSSDELLLLLEGAIRLTALPENRELRQKRIRAMVFAQHNQDLFTLIKDNHIGVANYLADTFKIAQAKGLIKKETNLLALAYWLQGLYFGHLMLDSTQITDLDDEWNTIAVTALRTFLVL